MLFSDVFESALKIVFWIFFKVFLFKVQHPILGYLFEVQRNPILSSHKIYIVEWPTDYQTPQDPKPDWLNSSLIWTQYNIEKLVKLKSVTRSGQL